MTNDTDTLTLTAFLLARLAEDEVNAGRYVDLFPSGDMAPLFRRVLAEVEAKRRIVEMHADPDHACPMWTPGTPGLLTHVGGPGPCSVIRILAGIYADHPGYRW